MTGGSQMMAMCQWMPRATTGRDLALSLRRVHLPPTQLLRLRLYLHLHRKTLHASSFRLVYG